MKEQRSDFIHNATRQPGTFVAFGLLIFCEAAPMTLTNTRDDERYLCTRIAAEFREMPGLTLTLPQAARLFSVDRDRCERVLAALVEAGHLAMHGTTFASSRAGRRSA